MSVMMALRGRIPREALESKLWCCDGPVLTATVGPLGITNSNYTQLAGGVLISPAFTLDHSSRPFACSDSICNGIGEKDLCVRSDLQSWRVYGYGCCGCDM